MSKIGKAFMSLMLDKKAREALENAKQNPAPQTPSPQVFPSAPQASVKEQLDAKIDEVQKRADDAPPTDRKQLIQNALRVHAAKQTVLSDLTENQKLKLQVLAMKAMMPKPPSGPSGSN